MYNPHAALAVLEAAGTTAAAVAAVCDTVGSQYYRKSPDAKVTMLGLAALLRAVPLASLPPSLLPLLPQVLTSFASLQVQYEELRRIEAQLRRERAEMEEDADDEMPDFRRDDAADEAAAAAGAGDDIDSVYDHDEADGAADDEPVLAAVDDDTDYVKPEDVAAAAAARAKMGESAEDRHARIRKLQQDMDVEQNIPAKKAILYHVDHLQWVAAALMEVGGQAGADAMRASVPEHVMSALLTMVSAGSARAAAGVPAGEFGPPPPADDEGEGGEGGDGDDDEEEEDDEPALFTGGGAAAS